MKLEIDLTDEQLGAIADAVAARLDDSPKAPLTVSEFAKASNQSAATVYRLIESGHLATVPNIYKKLIPAKQLNKYQ